MTSRRPQGEGSVYRLADGRWRGVVNLGWHGGKRRRKFITRGTQADVVREVLSDLKLRDRPTVLVFNKIDRLSPEEVQALRDRGVVDL